MECALVGGGFKEKGNEGPRSFVGELVVGIRKLTLVEVQLTNGTWVPWIINIL